MRLIDADAFIKENQEIIDCEIDHPKYQDTLRELISQAPTVERPHSEWDEKDLRSINYLTRRCLGCGKYSAVGIFCMWCGADMRKEGEAE